MSLHKFVHCHVCPLKDTCSFSEKDASWRWHNDGQPRRRYVDDVGVKVIRIAFQEGDLSKMEKATSNCPLRRAIAFLDTLMAQELLAQINKSGRRQGKRERSRWIT